MNHLSKENSPYLLQHANNPVHWYPWGTEALEKAKQENKLIIVSIGYSACHWCHVMEHESFEDLEVAEVMNSLFVCIKVDREERPDIDQIYMSALQLMNGQGGWPLNCITLPDQRPIYGGTYFKKKDWISILKNIAAFYVSKPTEALDYAEKLTEGIQKMELIPKNTTQNNFNATYLEEIITAWKPYFDYVEGGHNRAPKFPLPNNFLFLLRYAHFTNDEAIHVILQLTLEKMAMGGIYDQLAGGFCRYSVDDKWKVPHFEKMLYDNAQLISLYAEAYIKYQNPLYKTVIIKSIEFCLDELYTINEGFKSAMDADSEGVEGKFYCWSKSEIDKILGKDANLFCAYYQITEDGNWEPDVNILYRKFSDYSVAEEFGLDVDTLIESVNRCTNKLVAIRENRIKPGIDDKQITAWNALMIKGLCDAYKAIGDESYLRIAMEVAIFIKENLWIEKTLFRTFKNGKAKINGFLDDYAATADAFISIYELSLEEEYLEFADTLIQISLEKFQDKHNGLFFYTSMDDENLIARKHEVSDNVIPSSNSILANVLFRLGTLLNKENYINIAIENLQSISPKIKVYGSAYSNWAILLLQQIYPNYEVVFSGSNAKQLLKEMATIYFPNKIICGSTKESTLPLLLNRWNDKETVIYICKGNTCQLPVYSIKEALVLLSTVEPI